MTINTAIVPGFQKLSPDDLFSLEQYSKQRPQFRPQVLAHKRRRTLQVGPTDGFVQVAQDARLRPRALVGIGVGGAQHHQPCARQRRLGDVL